MADRDRRRDASRWVVLVFVAGSADRVDVLFGLDYAAQIWVFRVLVFVVPVVSRRNRLPDVHRVAGGERVEEDRHRAEAEARAATERA